jgi:hypothetical protein
MRIALTVTELVGVHGTELRRRPAAQLSFLTLLGRDLVKIHATWLGDLDGPDEQAAEEARIDFLAKLAPLEPTEPPRYSAVLLYDSRSVTPCLKWIDELYAFEAKGHMERGELVHTLERELSACDDRIVEGALAIHRADLTREWIWESQRQSFWAEPPDLRLDDFRRLQRKQLNRRGLLQRFGGGVWFAPEPSAPPTPPAP